MYRQKWLFLLLALLLVAGGLVVWGNMAAAQPQMPYTPSGIPASDLGETIPPGWTNVRLPPQEPALVNAEIQRILQMQPGPLAAPAPEAVPDITPEISALAADLQNDSLAIYDYVHNQIAFIPTWGLLKNPRETLLAGAGNAFDQAALLVALLEAAGFDAQYVWGEVSIDKTEALNWVGATDPDEVGTVFASGGIPTTDTGAALRIDHVWVTVNDNGNHALDPSFKNYSEQAGQDLRALMGYNLNTFVNRAESGANITSNYVEDLNQANIASDLAGYATNLVTALRNADPFIPLEDVIGGRSIDPVTSTAYPAALPYTVVQQLGQSDTVADEFAYMLSIQMSGIDYTTRANSIAGERITLFFECATTADCNLLAAGGGIYDVVDANQINVVPKLRVGGQVVATGSAVTLGSWDNQMDMSVTMPTSSLSPTTFASSQYLTAGEWYALPMRLQTVSNQALSRHIDLLNEAMAQSSDPNEEAVLGQILYLLGLSYFNEVELGNRIDTRLAEVVHAPHFSWMIASRSLTVWYILDNGEYVPYRFDSGSHGVDVRLNLDTAISAQNPANADGERAWFLSGGMRGSAAEHAIIEQYQNIPAVSTIQVLKEAMNDGQRLYHVTAANWSSVSPNLSNHSSGVLASIEYDVMTLGREVIISQNPVTYHQWVGSGWISYDPDSGSAGYLIAGYVDSSINAAIIRHGGSGAMQEPLETTDERSQNGNRFANAANPIHDRASLFTTSNTVTADPIDTTNGAFLDHHVDVPSLNGLGIPLDFERFYSSERHNLNNDLGFGWSHTYSTRFYTNTHWGRGFGDRLAIEAAPALAAAQAGFDLFNMDPLLFHYFGIDTTATHWLKAQITDNAATVVEPDGHSAVHVQLVDGTYQPPAGRDNLAQVMVDGLGQADLLWESGLLMAFDADGRLITLKDANGNATSLSYSNGRLTQVTDAAGRSLTLSYDGQDRIIQISDPAGRTVGYSYDGPGNLQQFSDARGGVTTYGYDSAHRITTVIDPTGTTYVDNTYDVSGRVASQVNGRNEQTSLHYMPDRTISTDPEGYDTTFFFDERRRLTGIEDALGNSIDITYDAADHGRSYTDGLGNTTLFAYDDQGHLTTTTVPTGHTTTWTYDAAAGDPTSYTDERGETWQFGYDDQHNLTSATTPLGNVYTYSYNATGQPTSIQDPGGVATTYSYDAHGNLACITNAPAETTCWAYDAVGRPTSFTNGTGNVTQFAYDDNNNLTQFTNPAGAVTGYTYDANDNLVTYTTASGNTTTYDYDAQFNLTSVTDALGYATTYNYDGNDNLVKITDPNNHATTYDWDAANRLTGTTNPLNHTVSLVYDAANRIVQFGRADGSQILYSHDALGRLTGIDYPVGTDDVMFTYDAAGNVLSAASGSAWNATYTYDENGRLIEIDNTSRGLALSYGYDAAGRRTQVEVVSGVTTLYDIAYRYNAAGRMNLLTDQTGSPTGTAFSYDAAGRLERITDPGGAYTTYAYNNVGHVESVAHYTVGSNLIAMMSYAYDANGNITTVSETTPTTSFTTGYAYDALDRLTAEIYPRYTINYAHDAAGNLTRRTEALGVIDYSYDNANQLQNRGGESYGYDVHGNRTSWQNARGTYVYDYDVENRLTGLTLPDNVTLAYGYDAFGRRITGQEPAGNYELLHNGLDIILQGVGSLDQETQRYLFGNHLLIGRYANQWGFTAYHGDGLENTRYLLDSNGRAFATYQHDAFGRSGPAAGIDPNPFRFAGQRSVFQHQLPGWPAYLMGFRDYDAGSGSFPTRDSLPGNRFNSQSLNDYTYAFNNPIRFNDPSGLRPAPSTLGDAANVGSGAPRIDPSDQASLDLNAAADFAGADMLELPEQAANRATSPSLQEEPDPEGNFVTSFPRSGKSSPGALATDYWTLIGAQGSTYALACTADNNLLGGAFQAGLFHSAPSSQYNVWEQKYDAAISELLVVDSTTVYAGAWYDGVLKSSNGGQTWTAVNQGLEANRVYALIANPNDVAHLFAGTDMGLFVSDNGGAAWQRPAGSLPGHSVSELAYSGNTLLAVTDYGLYRSANGGATWQAPTSDLPVATLNTLLASASSNIVWAGTSLGLFRSTDGGDTWVAFGAGLDNVNIHALAVDPDNPNHLVAGSPVGLWASTDGGQTRATDANAGLAGIGSQVGALAFCNGGGDANLYVGAGGGVYALRTAVAPASLIIDGIQNGDIGASYTFTATVMPAATSLPLTLTWEATDHDTRTREFVYNHVHQETFTWSTSGEKVITVTASNGIGTPIVNTFTLEINSSIYLPVILRE